MKKSLQYFFIALLAIAFLSCADDKKIAEEIKKVPVVLIVKRFDKEFAESDTTDLAKLKASYPYLFPTQFSDSLWKAKLNTDTLQLELEQEVLAKFEDFAVFEDSLELMFKHAKYYLPRLTVPQVVTVISEVDYNNRVILSDSLLLLGLDNYLGSGHRFYAGLPNYVSKGLAPEFMLSDITGAMAKKVNHYPRNRTFLSRMIYYGKELYLKDKLIPWQSDGQKIGYTLEELNWANENEEQIWRYFIENELLYNTDTELEKRFLDPAPFSKFRLELDSETPGRLGRYIGWQIVRAYADNYPDMPVQDVLEAPAEEIFKKSNYKPKR